MEENETVITTMTTTTSSSSSMTSKTSEKAIKKKSESTGKKKSKKSKKSDPEKENISVVSFCLAFFFCFVCFVYVVLHKSMFFFFICLIIQCSEHEKLNGYTSVQSIVKNNPFFLNSINEKNSIKIIPVNYGRIYSWKNKKIDEEEIEPRNKVIIPSGKSLHEDDLSYIDVKNLVSFFKKFFYFFFLLITEVYSKRLQNVKYFN